MKKIYTLTFLLLCFSITRSQGQPPQFMIPNLTIPVIEGLDTLQNGWAGGLNAPLISEVDADLDGIKDLYMYDRSNARIMVLVNNGSTTANPYHYDYSLASKFPPVNSWALLADYD